ncbi:MAG: murein biosynthesis integral membrane protein MurJ [Gordonia sp. (in: high G+C Gram-positive bacteria)]|uniref:murein biosynthesis integral membrane protein MurJ n=1 Tax=Gordonia sp. (in: high G+C Gram-positive bacteria) TaxID=84139 RepID=UPI0039E2353B
MTSGPDDAHDGRHESAGRTRAHPQRHAPVAGRHETGPAAASSTPDILTPEPEPRRRPQKIAAAIEKTEAEQTSDASVMKTGGSIAVATLISRITGFIRTVLVLAMLGQVASAFQAAYVLPNMIAEVVLGAVLTAIVIPVLVRAEAEDADGGREFINRIFTLTLTVLGAATLIAVVAAPLLTILNVGADSKVDRSLTTSLAYLLLPGILFYGLSALFMAILNVKNVFKPGAWAPVVNNIVQIVTLVAFAAIPGDLTDGITDPKILVLGIGTTIGVIVQAVMLLPYLKKVGVRLSIKWGLDARLRQFGNMALAIITYVLILQVGLIITYRIGASATEDGIAAYATHWQLLQLPYGVLGVTILTAIMPRLSRNAAADDTPAVIDDMSLATRLTMIALVPTVAFMTFFGPAIGLAIFNFGKFHGHEASQLGSVLAWGAFTLIPYAMTLVQLRVFYAREDAWTPTLMVLGITVVKVALSYLGPVIFDDPDLVVRWLAVANGAGYLVGAIVGHYLLVKRLGNAKLKDVTRTSYLTIIVSVVVAAAVWGVARLTHLDRMSSHDKISSIVYLGITGIVVLGVIYLLLTALRLPDMMTISDSVRRLLGRFIPALAPAPTAAVTSAPTPAETTMTIRFSPVGDDMPFASQVEVHREYDANTSSWKAVTSTSGGAVGETMVIPKVVDGAGAVPAAAVSGPLPQTVEARAPEPPAPEPAAAVPTAAAPASAPVPAQPGARGPRLIAGALVGGGRYRLLEQHGGTRGLQFWHASDVQLGREVGLTFVDPDQQAPAWQPGDAADAAEGPQAVLNRTRRLGQLRTPGVAQVLDVVRGASGGIVVTEWVRGSSLADVASTDPSATGAARAVRALANGAELAHRAGAALSIDHPDRIRVSVDGDAVLAFPAVLDGDDRATDVRGLGAVLYALLLNRWPLDDASGRDLVTTATVSAPIGGMEPAEPDPADPTLPIAPAKARAGIPFDVSTVTARALEGGQGIRTAGTVAHILDSATVVDLPTEVIPRDASTPVKPLSVAPISRTRRERLLGEGESGKRNGALLIGAGLFVVFLVIALVLWLTNAFGAKDQNDLDEFLPSTATTAPGSSTAAQPHPVALSSVTLYDPNGDPDTTAQQRVGNILRGTPPPWKTSQYRGTAKFGNLKDGIGLMFRIPAGSKVSAVTIATETPGLQVEIRSANRAKPKFAATSIVGNGTLSKRTSTITLAGPADGKYVLVWITQLAKTDEGYYQAVIDKISMTGD